MHINQCSKYFANSSQNGKSVSLGIEPTTFAAGVGSERTGGTVANTVRSTSPSRWWWASPSPLWPDSWWWQPGSSSSWRGRCESSTTGRTRRTRSGQNQFNVSVMPRTFFTKYPNQTKPFPFPDGEKVFRHWSAPQSSIPCSRATQSPPSTTVAMTTTWPSMRTTWTRTRPCTAALSVLTAPKNSEATRYNTSTRTPRSPERYWKSPSWQ